MKYTSGSIGRVFVLKFENEDVLLDTLSKFIRKQGIKSATLVFIGALKNGTLACGPKKPVIPPKPNKVIFNDGWEVMGIGTVFSNSQGPQIHIHGAMGKKLKTLIGCVREQSKVFLVVEAVLFELKGVRATKNIDETTGLNLLKVFENRRLVMAVKKVGEKYRCNVCGNEVEVKRVGGGTLVCCGQDMEKTE